MSIKVKSGLKVTQARHFQLQKRELETVLFIVPFSQTRQLQKKKKSNSNKQTKKFILLHLMQMSFSFSNLMLVLNYQTNFEVIGNNRFHTKLTRIKDRFSTYTTT